MNLPDRKIIPPELLDKYYDSDKVEFRRRITEAEKTKGHVGRNSPCPCGSGKKLKYCCLKRK